MIKTGLKIYKKNIWEVFALIGFISIGLFIGLFIIFPLINNLFTDSVTRISNSITSHSIKTFDNDKFVSIMSQNLTHLDWSNPVRTLKALFTNNALFNLIANALHQSGVPDGIISSISNDITTVCHDAVFTSRDIGILFISIVCFTAFIGYLLTKIIVQARSTSNNNIFKFILSFALNFISILFIVYLIILTLVSIKGALLYVSIIAIFLLMLLLSLLISILIYKEKEISFKELFNFKSFISLILATLISVMISSLLINVVFIFSDLVALLIAIPLLIVTSIIIENITISYVSGFNLNKKQKAI